MLKDQADNWERRGTSPEGYRGRHAKRRRDTAPDWISLAQCKGWPMVADEPGCDNGLCPKHHPEAYAEHEAKHTPESEPERYWESLPGATLGQSVDVSL